MKYLFALFLLIPFTLFGQMEKTPKFKETKPEVMFLRQVEQAARAHDADKLMSMMEPGYKRSQHDEFLEGRTLQFLTEFFCSGIPFNEIEQAKLESYTQMKDNKNMYEVQMYIGSGASGCTSTFFLFHNPKTGVLSIFGAVG